MPSFHSFLQFFYLFFPFYTGTIFCFISFSPDFILFYFLLTSFLSTSPLVPSAVWPWLLSEFVFSFSVECSWKSTKYSESSYLHKTIPVISMPHLEFFDTDVKRIVYSLYRTPFPEFPSPKYFLTDFRFDIKCYGLVKQYCYTRKSLFIRSLYNCIYSSLAGPIAFIYSVKRQCMFFSQETNFVYKQINVLKAKVVDAKLSRCAMISLSSYPS